LKFELQLDLERISTMNIQELRSAESGVSREYQTAQWQKWFAYVFCAAIGLVTGAIGVALAIGLMIIVTQISAIVFDPNSYMLIGVAVLFSLAISWLVERMLRYVMPGLDTSQRHLQVVFVFSVLIVLLEGFIFMP